MNVEDITVEQLLEARPDLVDALATKVSEAVAANVAKDTEPVQYAAKAELGTLKPVEDNRVTEAVAEVALLKSRLAEVEQARAVDNCATVVAQVIEASEGLGEVGRKRIKEMFAGQVIPATEIHARVTEAIATEKAYQLELLREAGVRTRVTGTGGGAPIEADEAAARDYERQHEAWLRDKGLPVPEPK